MSKHKNEDRPERTSFPLRMPRELDKLMAEGAQKTGLSKSDFMRLSMARGAEWLLKALTLTPEQLAGIPGEPEPLKEAA